MSIGNQTKVYLDCMFMVLTKTGTLHYRELQKKYFPNEYRTYEVLYFLLSYLKIYANKVIIQRFPTFSKFGLNRFDFYFKAYKIF